MQLNVSWYSLTIKTGVMVVNLLNILSGLFLYTYPTKKMNFETGKNLTEQLNECKFNIILMGILAGLEQFDFLHGKM